MQTARQRGTKRLWVGWVCVIIAFAVLALAQAVMKTSLGAGLVIAGLGVTVLAGALWIFNEYLCREVTK